MIGATVCWGFENNCTRSISEKSTYEIVTIKGFGSGIGPFLVACMLGETMPKLQTVGCIMLLGTCLIVYDTLLHSHRHAHTHAITHTHDGTTHTHVVEHSHDHVHVLNDKKQGHTHPLAELEQQIGHSS